MAKTILDKARESGEPLKFKVLVTGMDGEVWGDFTIDEEFMCRTDRTTSGWEIDATYVGEEVLTQAPNDFIRAMEEAAKEAGEAT